MIYAYISGGMKIRPVLELHRYFVAIRPRIHDIEWNGQHYYPAVVGADFQASSPRRMDGTVRIQCSVLQSRPRVKHHSKFKVFVFDITLHTVATVDYINNLETHCVVIQHATRTLDSIYGIPLYI